MNKQEIIDSVGLAEYSAAAKLARKDSARPDFGKRNSVNGETSDLPGEITDLIWESEGTWQDRIVLFFSIYDDMPCYGYLMDCFVYQYPNFSAVDRDFWWEQICERLEGEDSSIKNPLLYSLWCDYFENSKTVGETWQLIINSHHFSPGLMKTILPFSSPVPYTLKRLLYQQFLPDISLHSAIFESLIGSVVDVYGNIDAHDALDIISQLKLSSDWEETRSAIKAKLKESI